MQRIITALLCLVVLTVSACCMAADAQENIVIPRSELEAIKARISEMEREIRELKSQLALSDIDEAVHEEGVEEDSHAEHGMAVEFSASDHSHSPLPNISVVGDFVGRLTSDGFDDEDNGDDLFLREIEIAFQGYLYPQVRSDIVLSMEREDDLNTTLEEGYVSFLHIGDTSLNSQLGKMRLDFGKVNKQHPHEWYYVTPPLVNRNFLTDHGVLVNGGSLGYLFRTRKKPFASLEGGVWSISHHGDEHESDEHENEFGPGFRNRVYSGRLWTSTALSDSSKLQLGASIAHGSGTEEEFVLPGESDQVTLSGFDLTYQLWSSVDKRFMLQSEYVQQRRIGQTNFGYYALANYQWNKYWDFGLRYDWSQRPVPSTNHDSGISAILTNHRTESTKLRLQYTRGNSADDGVVNEGFFQVIWGIGHHDHSLEQEE